MIQSSFGEETADLDLDNIPTLATEKSEWNFSDSEPEVDNEPPLPDTSIYSSGIKETSQKNVLTPSKTTENEHSVLPSRAGTAASTPGTDPEGARARRRTRGISLLSLPIGQSVPNSTPPKSLNLTSPLSRDIASPGIGSPLEHVSTPMTRPRQNTVSSESSSSSSIASTALTSDNQLSEQIKQLVIKEEKVNELKDKIASLRLDLREAEIDLSKHRNSMKELASQVYANQKTMSSIDEHNNDVLEIGKRALDGLNNQLWSFLGDVRSATMGTVEFENDQKQLNRQPSRHSLPPASKAAEPQLCSPEPIRTPEAAPRRLSPKRSIQNFIKNRSPSPIRRPLSPERQQELLEQEGLRTSQRLRESDRLSKKLSQIDLRPPSSPHKRD